jgi:energy-converting hydrogenase Eha subunit C
LLSIWLLLVVVAERFLEVEAAQAACGLAITALLLAVLIQ